MGECAKEVVGEKSPSVWTSERSFSLGVVSACISWFLTHCLTGSDQWSAWYPVFAGGSGDAIQGEHERPPLLHAHSSPNSPESLN